MKWTVIFLVFFNFAFSIVHSQSIEQMKREGSLRRACSKRGNTKQPPARVQTGGRLKALRQKMVSPVELNTASIDAYFITSNDEHQSEDVDEYEQRRKYISGFSGSNGDVIVTLEKAALWTDSRYHLQADEQLDCNWLLMREGFKNIPTRMQWLLAQLPNGGRLGLNPKLISETQWQTFMRDLNGTGVELVALDVDLVDLVWPLSERGTRRSKDAFVLSEVYAGKSYVSKLVEVRQKMKELGAGAMVVTSLDEIAWLLNIRGRDVPLSPFLRSYAFLDFDNIFLYVNYSQLVANRVNEYLAADQNYTQPHTVNIRPYDSIWDDLRTFSQKYRRILVPSDCVFSPGASHSIYTSVFPDRRLWLPSPIIFLKAIKNDREIMGMRDAHVRDAVAVCDCFAYLEKRFNAGDTFTELDMVVNLDRCRYEQKLSLGNSFQTIVAFGPNGAKPHYIPTNNTNVQIFDNSTILIDSGGQYYTGTTDVTRTLHYGKPTEAQKEAYTRVLIGTIQFLTLTFPDDLKFSGIDVLARQPLWEKGENYLHGTSHGIGSFLSFHESPILIRYDHALESIDDTFKPGYFLTCEPGFYLEGEFGIRLENVLQVIEKPWLHSEHTKFLGFKTITLIPYEPKLIKLSLLSFEQRQWLNRYNAEIRSVVGAELKRQNKMDAFYWMMEKTAYIPLHGSGNFINGRPYFILIAHVFIVIFTGAF